MMKKTYSGWFAVFAAAVFALCAFSCAGSPAGTGGGKEQAAPKRGALIRTEPGPAPDWVHSVPKSPADLFFVGISTDSPSEASGRESARDNAARQVSRYYGEFLQSNVAIRSRYAQSGEQVLSDLTEFDEDIASFAQAVVTQLNADSYFTEVYRGAGGGEVFVVYALCRIPRQKAEADVRDFARTISERYGNLLAKPDSLMTALNSYSHVLNILEENPLHRASAYYNGKNGQVNLYDYLITEMNTMAASVVFAPVASSIKQSDEAFEMTLRISSSYAPAIGPLDLETRLGGGQGAQSSLVAPDNTASVRIGTGALQRGKYTVLFEMPLAKTWPALRANPQGSYAFEIKTASASLAFEGTELSARERASFRETVQQAIQRYGAPVRLLTDQQTPSGGGEYVILVNYSFSTKKAAPPMPTDMYYCNVSLALLRNGAVVRQSDPASFSEISATRLFSMAAAAVRDNRAFFTGLADSLSR